MDYQLQLKSFEKKDGVKYKIIQITDVTLHSSHKQPTQAIGKKIRQSIKQNKPARFYGNQIKVTPGEPSITAVILDFIQKDKKFLEYIQEEEKKGFKFLLKLPKEGVPVLAGKDTIQFMDSRNGKRVTRKLSKLRKN